MASLQGDDRVVMVKATDLRQALIILQSDYIDQRTRSSAEGERALNGYYRIWRLEPLLEGLKRKVDLLSELTTTASASLARKYEVRIQFILTVIGFLGLISLVSGIQDYLAGGYDPRDPEWLPSVAVTLSKVTVLVSSLTLVLILVTVFWLLLRWKK